MTHSYYLKKAIEESLKSVENGSSPFGALVVNEKGEIIGTGHNQVVSLNDPSAHGEVMAIRDACQNIHSFDLSGCTLYSSCEPCPMCLNTAKWANIKEIVYAATREDAEKIGFRDKIFYEEDPVILTHLEESSAQDVMQKWYQKEDKKEY